MKGSLGSARQEKAAVALACGLTVKGAAQHCKASERTVYCWLTEDAFCARIRQLRADMVERTCARLTMDMAKARATLKELLDATDPRIQLAAAQAIFNVGARLRDQVEIDSRLSALEERSSRRRETT
jgi:hypothetical protein